ncbi:MAG TPA: hypothetical protein VK774_09355 [Solirubrobacteraceae bacterium]|nr:hypothetical protein [Solirubrobacteraceae bacterium]
MPAVGHSVRQKVVAAAAVAALLAGGAFAAVSATGESNGHPHRGHAVHRLRAQDVAAAAAYLGLSPQQLDAQLDSSKSLAQLADARSGKSEQGVIDAIVAARRARLAKTSANLPKRIGAEVKRPIVEAGAHGVAGARSKRTALGMLGRFTASGRPGAIAAHYLGIAPARLRFQLHSGETLAQIASATPAKSSAGLLDALVAAKTKRLAGARPADAATRARLARKTKRVHKRMQVLLARKFAGAAGPG